MDGRPHVRVCVSYLSWLLMLEWCRAQMLGLLFPLQVLLCLLRCGTGVQGLQGLGPGGAALFLVG